MDERTSRTLAFVGSQLVFVTAFLHLALGLFNWWRWLQGGFLVPRDGRWPLFIVSGLAIFVGIYLAWRAENRRPYYAAGVVVMLGYVAGYFTWHLLGHRPWILFGRGAGTESISVQWIVDHALAGPLVTVSLLAEVVAAAILLALFFGAPDGDTQLTLDEAVAESATNQGEDARSE